MIVVVVVVIVGVWVALIVVFFFRCFEFAVDSSWALCMLVLLGKYSPMGAGASGFI
jgi:hypothetical protein